MSVGLTMHRDARTYYSGSLEPHLAEGEALSGTPEVRFERREGGLWIDRTDQALESASATIGDDGLTVEFWKKAAAEDEQLAGVWRVTAIVTSSDGEVVVGWVPILMVG